MGRRWRQRPEVLAHIAADIAREAPDHVAVTGDLTNLSLPAEFAQAHGWLSGLGAPATVSVIAGHHDWLTGSVEAEAEIGRASWRERVCQNVEIPVVAVTCKQQKKQN